MPPRRVDRAAGVLLGAVSPGGRPPGTPDSGAAPGGAWRRSAAAYAAAVLPGPLAHASFLALSHLCDPPGLARAARVAGEAAGPDSVAGDACVLWAAAVRAAVLDGDGTGPAAGLDLLPAARRDHWSWWITQAQRQLPASFQPHDSLVPAMQAAWSTVWHTPVPADDPATGSFGCQQFAAALSVSGLPPEVAAAAGALLGARWGASAAPFGWLRDTYAGSSAASLVRSGALTATRGRDDARGWPSLAHRPLHPQRVDPAVPHPCDDGVLLGGLGARESRDADAVVSLCQIGHADFADIPDHLEFWLVDHPGDNNQTAYVIDQAARAVAAFRTEGKRVFLHCHAGLSRTPAVAARYACLTAGLDPASAFAAVAGATARPTGLVNPELHAAVYELAGQTPPPPPSAPHWTHSRH